MRHAKRLRHPLGAAAACVLSVVLLAAAGPADARSEATLQVCATGGAPYATIQAAVDAASAGDTIDVCAGTFPEQVMITESLTLVGEGAGQTTIQLPATPTGTQDIVTVSGVGVSVDISGFTISGPGPTNDCSGQLSGVFVRDGANASIHDNVFTAIRNQPIDGCQKGVGIRVGRAALSTSGTATITGNVIEDYQKGGIVVDGAGSAATIEQNTVTGVGQTDAVGQNGIQVSRSASATVTGNTVTGNSFASSGSDGILLYSNLGTVTVSNNSLKHNDYGISALSVSGGDVTVDGNTILGGDRGISVSGSNGLQVSGNDVFSAGTYGIYADDSSAANVFHDNSSSGVPLADCLDSSSGSKTAGTANTWTGNTGTVARPDAICAPAAAPEPTPPIPPGPPIDVGPPPVIVLPPLAPGGKPPLNPSQPVQPAGPIAKAVGNEIIVRMRSKQLKSCLIDVVAHGNQKVTIARGFARAPKGRSGVLVIRLGPMPSGEKLLSKQFGGVLVDVKAVCRSAADAVSEGVKIVRAVLAVERVTTPPGSWVPDQAVLTATGNGFLRRLHARLVALKGIRCDGYTAVWPPSLVHPYQLSLERARLACAEVRGGAHVPLRLVGHGLRDPIASNATEAGRRVNRRVTITFVHLLARRTSGS